MSPALAAGEFSSTWVISAPCGLATPSEAAMSGVTSWQATPIHGRATEVEPAIACATTVFTMSEGMAKPIPIEPPVREKIAVLMPISAPSRSTSAPPELPGLMAASVWMKKPESLIPRLVRATAETMPLVTVWPTPNGLPTASTRSPTSSLSELPNAEDREGFAAVIDLQDREIGALVLQQDLCLELAAVGRAPPSHRLHRRRRGCW